MTHHRKLRSEKLTTHSVRSVQVEKKDAKAEFTVKSSDFTEPHEVQVQSWQLIDFFLSSIGMRE